jgi:hypothetical protein
MGGSMVVVEQETTLRLAGSIFAFSPNDLIKINAFQLFLRRPATY